MRQYFIIFIIEYIPDSATNNNEDWSPRQLDITLAETLFLIRSPHSFVCQMNLFNTDYTGIIVRSSEFGNTLAKPALTFNQLAIKNRLRD